LKRPQNATDATDVSRDCCSEVNAAWACCAQSVEIDGLGLLLRLGRRRQLRTGKRTNSCITRRTRIGKPPGLPLPRMQLYLEFYLNHAKIDDGSPEATFTFD
jgi:hypothetical protein